MCSDLDYANVGRDGRNSNLGVDTLRDVRRDMAGHIHSCSLHVHFLGRQAGPLRMICTSLDPEVYSKYYIFSWYLNMFGGTESRFICVPVRAVGLLSLRYAVESRNIVFAYLDPSHLRFDCVESMDRRKARITVRCFVSRRSVLINVIIMDSQLMRWSGLIFSAALLGTHRDPSV